MVNQQITISVTSDGIRFFNAKHEKGGDWTGRNHFAETKEHLMLQLDKLIEGESVFDDSGEES